MNAERAERWAAAGAAGGHFWRVRAAGLILGAALWFGAAGVAGAEAEWCDTGSPPPNDFRLQPTGVQSATSSPAWLRSTDNGGALLETYAVTGSIDVSQVSQLQGGVASGMTTAVSATSNAPSLR
jgi:hypothetical protein